MSKIACVVLHVEDDPKAGIMPSYQPQVAMIHEYESLEAAACWNVGNHPDAARRRKPYRVIVIPKTAWHEFQVFSESIQGRENFKAYPSVDPTMKAR